MLDWVEEQDFFTISRPGLRRHIFLQRGTYGAEADFVISWLLYMICNLIIGLSQTNTDSYQITTKKKYYDTWMRRVLQENTNCKSKRLAATIPSWHTT